MDKLEKVVAGWYQKLPSLSADARRWLADNIWWVVLIVAILQGLTVLGVGLLLLMASGVLVGAISFYGAAIGSVLTSIVLASLAFSIINLILLSLAVSPLRAGLKRGWRLIFAVMLVNVVSIVIGLIFRLDIFSFLLNGFLVVFLTYFLFEIRNYFSTTSATKASKKKQPAR